MRLYSVTEVLSPFADFSRVNPTTLENAAARGSRVHSICAAIAQDLWVPEIPDECAGYIESFRGWFEYVDEVVGVEVELKDLDLGFVGHLDLMLKLRGDFDLSITDLKTPVTKHPLWKAQLAAYKHLAEKAGYKIKRVFSLRLSPEGKAPKVEEYLDSAQDLRAFLAALTAYRYFKGGAA